MTSTYNVPVRRHIWIYNESGSVLMIDAFDVISITALKVPGAPRHMPGGVTVQDPASYEVTFRFRSGATDRVTLGEASWAEVRAAIEKDVTP